MRKAGCETLLVTHFLFKKIESTPPNDNGPAGHKRSNGHDDRRDFLHVVVVVVVFHLDVLCVMELNVHRNAQSKV